MWIPSADRIASSNMAGFFRFAAERGGPDLGEPGKDAYERFHLWSIENREKFWPLLWDFCGVVGESGATTDPRSVLAGDRMAPPDAKLGPRWFPNARLNFAENLLRFDGDEPAIVSWNERGLVEKLSFRELKGEVITLALALKGAGVEHGDRVAGFLPNIAEAVIAMLATSAVGAVWSSCSPDFGVQGVLDRFGQIEPKILFCAERYIYAGKEIDLRSRIDEIAARLPSVRHVVRSAYDGSPKKRYPDPLMPRNFPGARWGDFAFERINELTLDYYRGREMPQTIFPTQLPAFKELFPRLPFDHPLYIMYSSGTTGLPKCMVHGAGGTLLQHQKEHVLHTDLKRGDRIFYSTTCGWMMWNWLASALAVGATIVLYDGAPLSPSASVLWDMVEREKLTVFGTSAKYLALLEKSGVQPGRSHDLSALRTILSTGSPLAPHSFDFVYSKIKEDLHLASVSGGTDIIACFVIGNPTAPVYRGEIQARALGMDVDIFDENCESLRGVPGELVCRKAFPSMPVRFWNDEDGSKYRAAYFEYFPSVWRHGDWAELTAQEGFIIYGRSDATLNPGGVRIGTAEIYRQVEQLPEVVESVAVGQEIGADASRDVRIVLFVRLREGLALDDELRGRITKQIRENTSPLYVPKKIIQIADIPRTVSGKISELAVRETIHGRAVKNREALANPESLRLYEGIADLKM